MPTQQDIETAALMTVHEFLLEIAFANTFAQSPDSTAAFEKFRRDFLDRIQYKARVGDDPANVSLLVQSEAVKFAERFCEKVHARMTDISD
jgi:hypothetical protein